jgi:hypothetical protein
MRGSGKHLVAITIVLSVHEIRCTIFLYETPCEHTLPRAAYCVALLRPLKPATAWVPFVQSLAITKVVMSYWVLQILPAGILPIEMLPVEVLQRLLAILEQRQRKLQNVACRPSVFKHSFLLLCSRTLQQAQQRGTNPSNPKAGQLAAKVARQNAKGYAEPQQPERLVVSPI